MDRRLAAAREAGDLEEGLTFENAVVRAVTRLDLSGSVQRASAIASRIARFFVPHSFEQWM
jgi:hypothetical protein